MNGGSEAAADADGGVMQIGGVEGLYMPQRHVVVGDDEMGGEFAPCGEVESDAEGAVEIGLRFVVHDAVERHACPQVEETELRQAAERGAEHHVDGVASVSYTHLDVYKRQVKIPCDRTIWRNYFIINGCIEFLFLILFLIT